MRRKLYLICVYLIFIQIQAPAQTISPKLNISKITIYWDTSLSMQNKDIAKEMVFLESYFKTTPNADVALVTFSNEINLQKTFSIRNSNWSDLKQTLLQTTYDGIAFYEILKQQLTTDTCFIFTDGIEVLDLFVLNSTTKTTVVNSSKKANSATLKFESEKSGGNFINLSKKSITEIITPLNSNSPINNNNSKAVNQKIIVDSPHFISGHVYNSSGPLLGATITVNGKKGVVTKSNGEFKIKASKEDVLTISYLGMKTQEILIKEDRKLEIVLISNETELEEVVVAGNSKVVNKVDTGYGKSNKEKIGYAVQSINADDLSQGRDDNVSLHGKFSGVTRYGGNDDISQMIFRANSMLLNLYPLILVDGTPMSRSSTAGRVELTNFIDPNNIAKITVLKGLAATNRYGSEGGNGVILITTKTALAGEKSENNKNTALLKNNNFTENLKALDNSLKDISYIKEYKQFKTLNDAYNYYLKQRVNYLEQPMYFVHISDYFLQFYNYELSSKILSNCLENNTNTIEVLKIVAYKAEQQQDLYLARKVYEKLLKLRPLDSQSYRDLALVYQETGNHQQALEIYKNIKSNSYKGVNFTGLEKVIDNEMRRLILNHKNNLDLTNVSDYFLKDLIFDARIVIDYTQILANFEIQFVNPQNKFFTWPHTSSETAMRIEEEKEKGFNTEEFLLIDAQKGEWQINIASNIKKSNTPIVLKYTVYKNYATSNETKEIQTIELTSVKEKKLLGKIYIK
jgi:TonB-dependent SusC/RagA subfamily outer membrane receptor